MVSRRYIGGYPSGPSQAALPTRFSKIRFDPSLIGCERGAAELQSTPVLHIARMPMNSSDYACRTVCSQ